MKFMLVYTIMEINRMKVAVLSGKGGTGKTLVAVNLANVSEQATYLDCDVEEPNGHLFFKPREITSENVLVKIPQITESLCIGCRKCVDFCKFNALAFIAGKVKLFDSICHSCGGCNLVCPTQAIVEVDKAVGRIETGVYNQVIVKSGFLNIGDASGVPIIKELLRKSTDAQGLVVVDCPPGSACVVMESISEADYCILVAESTIFGVHNLEMVYELVKIFKKAHAVILNKCLDGFNPAEEFCRKNNIKVLAKIPFNEEIGRLNSEGLIITQENKAYDTMFRELLKTLAKEVENERIINP